jgi:ankyrin repeat protein
MEIAKWNDEVCHHPSTLHPLEGYDDGIFNRVDSDEHPGASGQSGCKSALPASDARTTALAKEMTSNHSLDDGVVRLGEALVRRPDLLDIKDSDGQTLMHRLVLKDDLRLMTQLLAWGYGDELWAKDKWQRLPLHYARSAEMAELIWKQSPAYRKVATYVGLYGPMESQRDLYGATPLMTTARAGLGAAVRFLLTKMCRTLPSWTGRHIDFVGEIVDYGLHWGGRLEDAVEDDLVNAADLRGRTALHNAVLANDPIGADALASCYSVDIGRMDKANRTALHYAAAHKTFEAGAPVLHQILTNSPHKFVDVNIRDINGDAALHIAYRCQNTAAVAFLKEAKADATLIDGRGYLAMDPKSVALGCPEFQ